MCIQYVRFGLGLYLLHASYIFARSPIRFAARSSGPFQPNSPSPRYSRDLDPNETTHLIAASPCGDKYNFASRPEHADKIAIVGARWLLDCEKRGELLDTNDYKFSQEEIQGVKEEDDDDDDLDFGGVASLSVGEALDKLLSSQMGRGSVPPGPLFSRCQFCLLGFDGQNGRATTRKRGSRTSNDNRGGDERAQLKGKLCKLIRRERGTILWELSEHVTHLIVADDCGDSIRRAAVSFALQLQGPLVVAPRWIVASCSAQRLLPPTKYYPKPREEEMIVPKMAKANSQAMNNTSRDEGVGQDGQQAGRQPRRSSLSSSSQKIRSSLFKGAIFAFVRPTPPEWAVSWMNKSEFEECITAHGGCMLTQPILSALRKSAAASNTEDDYSRMGFGTRSRSGAPLTDRVCYIVSSGGYPQDQNAAFHPLLGELMKENLCKVISVTPLWIKTSIAEKRDVNASHFPYLFQPQLHHIARLPPSVQITVAVSGFVGGERAGIRFLLEAIGATYTDNMSKRNTHLISKTTSGPKYTKALEWGIKVVNVDWLRHITKHGYSGDGGEGGAGDDAGDGTRGCEVRFSLSDPKASQVDSLPQAPIDLQAKSSRATGQKTSATQDTISASYATEVNGKDLTHREQQGSKVLKDTAKKDSATPSSINAKRSSNEMTMSPLASPDSKGKKQKKGSPRSHSSSPKTNVNEELRGAKAASPGEHKTDPSGSDPRDSRVSRALVGLDEGIRPVVARTARRRRGPKSSGRGSQESLTPKEEEKANEDREASSRRDSQDVNEGAEPSDPKSPEMSSPSDNQKQLPDMGAESQMIWYEAGFTQY